jgi:lysophospholipase L1-like esterase
MWATSPQAATSEESPMSVAGFNDQTVRNIVYAGIGGSKVRVRLSNTYGRQPLVIGSASIAIDLVGAETIPGTLHALTFGGRQSVTVAVGQEVFNDPVSLRFGPEQDLALSVFLPNATGPATYHEEGQQDSFVSTAGDSALDRFTRDVLDQSSVRDVIILEGVNDLGFSQIDPSTFGPLGPCFAPNTNVSAQQVVNGYEQLIAAAHAKGLRIFGAMITPFKDSFYWDAAAEKKRDTINNWIRTSGAFDGVVDFASVIADPYDPDIMNPIYDSGDHLHPNGAGYVAMGDAIKLGMLLRIGHPTRPWTRSGCRATTRGSTDRRCVPA